MEILSLLWTTMMSLADRVDDNGILIWTMFIVLLFLFIGWRMGLRTQMRAPEIVQVPVIPKLTAKTEQEQEYDDPFDEAINGPGDERTPTL